MKKVLLLGGTGTIGSSFIERYYNEYEFYNISRSEEHIAELTRKFPNVKSFVGNIINQDYLIATFQKVRPDVVVHAAAMKHIDLAEKNPSQAARINVAGSLNVINASIRTKVPITVGISTDKACGPESIYGYTKFMMERMFLEHFTEETKFVCTRFANVAHSKGSVIPIWKSLVKEGKPLRLTSPDMNRLMFSKQAASDLIQEAILAAQNSSTPFILSKIMKNVNMLELAKCISDDVEIVGMRPGERLNEALIGDNEVPFTYVDGDYVYIYDQQQSKENNLSGPHTSILAENMNTQELENLVNLE